MKARDVVRVLKAAGWQEARASGSHLQMTHPEKPGTVTVPMHGAKDIKRPTLASIARQAGVTLRSK